MRHVICVLKIFHCFHAVGLIHQLLSLCFSHSENDHLCRVI